MTTGALAGLLIAGIAALVSLLAFVSSSRATRIQASSASRAVDADAYNRAREIYESSLHQLEVQLARLQEQYERVSHQVTVSEDTISDLRKQLTTLQVSREHEIQELRMQLASKDALIAELRLQIKR